MLLSPIPNGHVVFRKYGQGKLINSVSVTKEPGFYSTFFILLYSGIALPCVCEIIFVFIVSMHLI